MHLESASSCMKKGHKALTFEYITTSQLHRGFDPTIDTVDGTKSFHAIRSCSESLTLETRTVGCTCKVCITHSKEKCQNCSVTDVWVRQELTPTNHPLSLYDIKTVPEFPLSSGSIVEVSVMLQMSFQVLFTFRFSCTSLFLCLSVLFVHLSVFCLSVCLSVNQFQQVLIKICYVKNIRFTICQLILQIAVDNNNNKDNQPKEKHSSKVSFVVQYLFHVLCTKLSL